MANEQALQDLYKEFVKTGYRGSKDEFKGLMSSNIDAFKDGYKSFTSTGYNGDETDFAELLGVTVPEKKKEILQENGDGVLEGGPLQLEEPPTTDNPPPATFNFGETNVDNSQAPQSKDPNAPNYVEEFKGFQNDDVSKPNYYDSVIGAGDLPPKDTRLDGYQDPVKAMGMYPAGDGVSAESVTIQIDKARRESAADRAYTAKLIQEEIAAEYPNQAETVQERNTQMTDFLEQKKIESDDDKKTFFNTEERLDVNNRKYIFSQEERKPFKDKALLEQELNIVTSDLINDDNNKATISTLTDQFSKYGFVFTKAYGSMVARTSDGNAEITIDIDPLFGVGADDEVADLKNFLMLNSSEIVDSDKNMDFIGNSLKAQNMRSGRRVNKNGTVSSHLMGTFEEDGKFLVAPTLFPVDDENQASYANNWIELKGKKALDLAKERNEVFTFDTQEEANAFADGSWKGVNTIDVEAQQFYKERGLDYQQISQSFNIYQETRDRIDFIEDLLDGELQRDEFGDFKDSTMGDDVNRIKDLSLKRQAQYGDLYVNGELRDDIQEELARLKTQETALFGTAFNNKVKDTRNEFDLYLRKKEQAKVSEAVFINDTVKKEQSVIDEQALIRYGEKPMNLAKAINENTTRQEFVEMQQLQTQTLNLNFERKNAAMIYENSQLYLNRMENKKIQNDFVDNFEGFTEEFANGLQQGHAANSILQYAMGVDLIGGGDDDDVMDIALHIVDAMNNKTGNQSKTMLNWEDSQGFRESWDVVASDPLEWSTQLASKSIAMMLPYGAQLIPMSGVIGAGTGAGYGALGANPLTIAIGAKVGLGYGLRVGFAATTYAMEYTNSILEAITETGYDIYNPDEVALALQDQKVWDVGGARGHARGIPIAIIDYFTAGLAGRLFMPAKFAITSKGVLKTAGLITAERLVLDPIGEGVGETLAQENEILFGTGRNELDFKEIAAEMGGAFGNQGSNAVINMTLLNSNKRRNKLLADFTDPAFLATYTDATPEQILNFVNKNVKLGKIDASKGKAITDNLGILKSATDLLGENADPAVVARAMRLIEAQNNLGSTINRREVFKSNIKSINAELSELILTGKLSDKFDENTKTIEGIQGPTGTKVDNIKLDPLNESKFDVKSFNQFKIGTSTYETPEDFLKAVDKMSKEKLIKSNPAFTIKDNDALATALNDYVVKKMLGIEQESFKLEDYANQKQSSIKIPSEVQTKTPEEVAEGVPGGPKKVTQQSETQIEADRKAEIDDYFTTDETDGKVSDPIFISLREQILSDTFMTQTEKGKAQKFLVALGKTDKSHQQKVDALNKRYGESRRRPFVFVETEIDKINAKYDAMLESTESTTEEVTTEELASQEKEYLAKLKKDRKKKGSKVTVVDDNSFKTEIFKKGKFVSKKNIDDIKVGDVIMNKQGTSFTVTEIIEDSTVVGGKIFKSSQALMNQELMMSQGLYLTEKTSETITEKKSTESTTEEVSAESKEIFDQQVKEMEEGLDDKVDFRLKDENKVEPDRDEIEAITQRINLLESDNVNTKIETEESNVKLDVQELNNRTDTDLQVTSIELIDGIPAAFTISDQLTTGNVVNPNTGTTIDNLKGSIGFNGTTGNEQAAWAGTTKAKAENMLQNAEFIYQANKPKIDEFWANNPEYNGLVPVNVVKMAESGIISNEAMFRVLADNLTKIPEENKVKALEALKTEIISRRDKANKKKPFNDIISLLEGKDIQSIDDVVAPKFVKKLGLGARVNLMNIIGYGTPNKPGQTKKAGAVSELSSVTTALLENQDESARELLNIASIAEIITDKQMKDVPEGSIVAIVGVDVLNPGVVETTHPNYKYGVRGKSMGVLTNPVSMEKAYPIAYKKAMGSLVEKESQGKKVTGKQLRTNQTGLGIGIPSKDYIGAKAGSQSNINKLNNFLNISFPGTTIYTDSETFKIVMNSEGVMQYSKGNQTVYGVTVNGDIYINPDVHNSESELFNTSIHEMGHVWTDYIQTTKKGKLLYERGSVLVKKTKTYKDQLKKFDGNQKKAVDEAMAILIGNKGETIANASLQAKFKEWLLGMWKLIMDEFKMSKDYSEAEIQDITLDEFIGSALADIFSGKEIELSNIQQKQLKNPEAAFKQGLTAEQMVIRGREMAMPDDVVAAVLRKRLKLNEEQILALMETAIPTAFTNAKGGINVGEQIFNQVEELRLKRLKTLPEANRKVLVSEDGGKTFKNEKLKAEALKYRKEERAARKKDLEDNKLFKEQPLVNQKQMIAEYDAMLGTKANQAVQQEIDVILAELKGRKDSTKVSKDIRKRLSNYIRKALTTVSKVNKTELKSILKTIAEVDDVNFVAEVLRVQEIVNEIKVKDKQTFLQTIKDYVKKKTKIKRSNKKPKSGSLEYRGQEYFKVLNKALNLSREAFIQKKVELAALEVEIEEALTREANLKEGKSLNKADSILLAEAEIYARYDNLETKSIEELNDIFKGIKQEAKQSRQELLKRRLKRKERAAKIKAEADESIETNYPFLYGEKGLKTDREVEDSRKSNIQQFIDKGFLKFMKDFADGIFSPFIKTESGTNNLGVMLSRYFDSIISNTQTLFNILDGRKNEFFTKYFQKPLSKANFKREEGVRDVNRYVNKLAERAGFKNKGNLDVNKAYQNFKLALLKKNPMILSGIDVTENNPDGTFNNPTNDQLVYIYAIAKNPEVRARLIQQGFTEEKFKAIEEHLGNDVIGFADIVVDYLTNDSYDSINEVYVRNNDVNLDKIENYFPLSTKLDPTSEEKSIGFQSDVFSTFTAESPSSLKMRSRNSIINPATSFTDMLDSHIESTERYKAYADLVPELNRILKIPSVKLLLKESGLTSLNNEMLNFAINGRDNFETNSLDSKLVNTIQGAFVSYVLGLKVWQIPKQASSFIEAFKKFRYKGNLTYQAVDKATLGIPATAVDAIMFLGRYTQTLALTLAGMEGGIKTAKKISAGFEQRMLEALSGKNLVELETGNKSGKGLGAAVGKFLNPDGTITIAGKTYTTAELKGYVKSFIGAGTSIGDVMGVMGYMANYNQDIANGMTETEAALEFVEYNLTQQSRRDMDKGGLQRRAGLLRLLTMFGSTMFLQMNNTAVNMRNIMRSIRNGKMPSKTDIRGFIISGAVANMAFQATANMLMLTKGDEDEKLEAIKTIKRQMTGFTQLTRVPILGAAAESGINYMMGEKGNSGYSESGAVEPLLRIVKESVKGLNEEDYIAAIRPFLELRMGFQFDPVEGTARMLTGEGEIDKNLYDILNVPKTQRPGGGRTKKSSLPPMWMIETLNNPVLLEKVKELNRKKREVNKTKNDLKKKLRNK